MTRTAKTQRLRLALCLLGLVAVSGCAHQSGIQIATERTPNSQSTEQLAVTTYERIWGTGEQKEAAHYLGWRAMTDPVSACMEREDAHYYRRFEPIWTGWQAQPLGDMLAPLDWRQSTQALAEAGVLRDDADERKPPEYVTTNEYRETAQACEKTMGDPTQWDNPPGVPKLYEAFDAVVASATEQAGSPAAYMECMKGEGIAVSDDGLASDLRSSMPLPPLPNEQPSERWTSYLSEETAALAADRKCRSDIYEAGMEALAQPLAMFVAEHESQLESTERGWAQYLTDAKKAGFDPSNPEVVD